MKTKAIIHFQTDHILTRFVFPPLKGNGLKYDGAIYPNRDYRVFLILPASIEQDLIYRIEPWKTRETNIPDFQ
ncbi:DUF5042 domain-containing protein [Phocaeicola vulgatus]|uniref:DUF5042 domain-containing protein n=1 Tax=Phocaeicola vulgatus TaxID=821 RepID=UPI001C24BBA8|nr:DUF5042 domain-containing protein [Phocaeicola vulgatus]MBU9040977.1 DUF5042 domain-containing protein [Phocaeicola vulgatus]